MKKILFGLLIIMSLYSNAQETEFALTADRGMTDFIVTNVQDKTATEIYKKTMEWIGKSFKNPLQKMISNVENESIVFQSYSETLFSDYFMGSKVYHPTKFQIEIVFKDGKYKFDIIGMQTLDGSDLKFFVTPMTKEELVKNYWVFKKDGTLTNTYKYANEVPLYFNNFNKELYDNIISTTKKNDGW